MTQQQINIPQALLHQAGWIWQVMMNVHNPAIIGSGLRPLHYEWPDENHIVYKQEGNDSESMHISGLQLHDFAQLEWQEEERTNERLVDEIEVPKGVPFTKTYTKTKSETTSLKEATTHGLDNAIKAGLGQNFGTGISITDTVTDSYTKTFGTDDTTGDTDTFVIGPVEEAGRYRIYSYGYRRTVHAQPRFGYKATWRKDDHSPDGLIYWWKYVDLGSIEDVLSIIRGEAPDSAAVLHSGRVAQSTIGEGRYSSPDVSIAPYFRASPQLSAEYPTGIPALTWVAEYGQGTRIERI